MTHVENFLTPKNITIIC